MSGGVAVVVGANRGIGLALVEQLKSGHEVFACVRKSTDELDKLQVNVITGVDVSDDSTVGSVENALGSKSIDILIIAAGSQETDKLENVTKDNIRRHMETNAIGPLFTIKALQSKLKAGSKVVIISSRNASITDVDFTGGELYGYRMSKVAVNIAGVTLAGDLKKSPGAFVALVHPGVVNTQMIRSLRKSRGVPDDKLTANTISPEESASKILILVDNLNESNSGSFWNAATGEILGW